MFANFSPYSFRHNYVLSRLSIDAADKGEICIKALGREEPVDKGVEKALVKVIVNAASIDALRQEGPHSTPGNLVRRKVSTTLDTHTHTKKK